MPGNRIINDYLLEKLKERVLTNYDILKKHEKEKGINLKEVFATKTVPQFNDKFIAKLNGFAGEDEMYAFGSSDQHVKNIKIPTLFIHSEDDPICVKE